MSDIADKIAKLQERAATLQTQLRAVHGRIAALQKQQQAEQQAEMLELVKAANLTPEQLRAILQSRATAQPATVAEIGENE